MLARNFFFLLLCYHLVYTPFVKSQSYVADTIKVSFKEGIQGFNHALISSDFRDESPYFISIYEKTKWIFFPVDQIVVANKPLSVGLTDYQNAGASRKYMLNIYEFYIDQKSTLFKNKFTFTGALELSRLSSTDTCLSGTFYYEETISEKKKIADSIAYGESLNHFTNLIISDVNAVCNDTIHTLDAKQFHFRRNAPAVHKNLYVSTDVYYGFNFWGIDAEIQFSEPEPSKKFIRKSRMFRYLHYEKRQSVSFSRRVVVLNYRLSDKCLFQNKSAFLIGFNKWNDIDESKRTFEEIFLLQATASQRIAINPLDKRSFIIGAGLMEEVSYIIYNDPSFHAGILISCAYKF